VDDRNSLLGKKLSHRFLKMEDYVPKPVSELRVAIICNWQTKCGISTYSKYLVDAMRPQVKELRIFSEHAITQTGEDGPEVERCWKRGECMVPTIKKVLDWNPDFVLIQHEFGIFPNAFYFMQMMQMLENVPYAVTLHSVYEHLDKIVYSACIKNIVCHSQQGKDLLRKMGNTSNVFVIPHGCVQLDDVHELWNICQNPYTVMQFGFGFAYKGVERALDAIHYLKNSDPKFKNIFYFYLISDNDYNSRHHLDYYGKLLDKVNELDLSHNVAMVRKYHSEEMLNLYLRLAKLAVFPYINNPNNTVYGASGAIRIALANKIPVVASESHLFDDLEGVVPRPDNYLSLANQIDEIFSNSDYRRQIVANGEAFIAQNGWMNIATDYLNLYTSVIS
jgi:glycosyltransferase involved in cell wall biosynthesis